MKRATDIEGMRERLARLFSKEGVEQGMRMTSRENDVFIAPYSKCGTTWLQQIVHSLRTDGDMDFDDISRVVPWIEASTDLGIDLAGPQRAEPRVFKSHLGFDKIPKPGRYIVSFRDPKDAVVSLYHFLGDWIFDREAISLDEFAHARYIEDPARGYWRHFRSWWEVREREDVLLLFFEDMKEDLGTTIQRVAEHCGIELDRERKELTLERASFDFMKRHGDRFDDRMVREHSEEVAGVPPGSDSSKVRKGTVGSHRSELSPELQAGIDEIWREELEGITGYPSYAALRAARPCG